MNGGKIAGSGAEKAPCGEKKNKVARTFGYVADTNLPCGVQIEVCEQKMLKSGEKKN